MRVLFLFVWVLLLCGGTGRAQGIDFNSGRLLTDSVTVVRPYRSTGGLVVLKVTVDGKRYRFLLDTGAPTILSSALQTRFRFPDLGRMLVYDAYRRKDSADVVLISELGIGDLRLAAVPALVVPADNPVLETLGVDGILGSNALRHLAVTISARRGTVTLTDGPALSTSAVPMRTDGDLQSTPEISVQVDGHPAGTFLFDSGFQGLCDLSQGTRRQLEEAALAIRVLQTTASYAGLYGDAPEAVQTVALQALEIGGVRLKRPAATVSGDTRSKIGAALLQQGDVTLDYRRGLFSFVPYSGR